METANNTYQFDGFIKDKTYYWRVRPFYDGRWMSWSNTIEFQIKDVSSVEFSENEFEIYPNPSTDYITINIGSIGASSNGNNIWASPNASIEIYDVMGVLVAQTSSSVFNGQKETSDPPRIDISNLSPGFYFVKIGDKVEKFIKI